MIKSTASLTAIKSAKIIATHILRPSLIISKPLTSTTGKTKSIFSTKNQASRKVTESAPRSDS